MKKWGLLVSLLCSVGVYCVSQGELLEKEVEIVAFHPDEHLEVRSEVIDEATIYQGNLVLVNHEQPVRPEGVLPDVIDLFDHREEYASGYGLLDANVQLSAEVAEKFSEMIQAARQDGVDHFMVNSGFRDFSEQEQLFQEMGPAYALPPGHSEHNLGLSLDIGSTLMKMEEAPEGEWLEDNAWKYGFILRYPKDKTDVTGIQYEPWHFRYVGLPHSAIMDDRNLALEEYLDTLKREKNLSVHVNDKEYRVLYFSLKETNTIQVPQNGSYEISGDNSDGIIVTMYE